ncbi:protein terminus [Anastrepha obliqua]|uniref:protein terminus n=1 Tax=Anastrepha obliqua TaxID=95512 RepID=UPI00240A8E45|nr:protein terminus [Anastrepha obliqua]
MAYFRSAYTFSITGTTRTFHHRWFMGGRIYECDACSNSCDMRAAYSQHWQPVAACAHGTSNSNRPLCSAEQREQLETIAMRHVDTFILCNEQGNAAHPKEFLIDAGVNAVPQLLRLLFHGAARLRLRMSFYTRPYSGADLLFNSSELVIQHHLDIAECVDMLFLMLLEKIEAYMYARFPAHAEEYCVKRIRLHVQRETYTKGEKTSMVNATLPLQYGVKYAASLPAQVISDKTIAAATLYCFRTCARTHEIYAVPYQLGKCRSGAEDDRQPWDTVGRDAQFIMLQNIDGQLQQLFEITNLQRFLRTDTGVCVHTCTQCHQNFTHRTKLLIHKSLDCGRGFEVLRLASNYSEIYKNCLPMRCDNYKWPLFGIIEE